MAAVGTIDIASERCKGCLLCIEVCPNGLLECGEQMNAKGYLPARRKEVASIEKQCTGCTMCAVVCPEGAIEVYREV